MDRSLRLLGIEKMNFGANDGAWIETGGGVIESLNPATGKVIASVRSIGREEYERVVATAQRAFLEWRMVPAPKRGEVVREIGNELRRLKEPLGRLVSLEMGKILVEGMGEVQEMIDIADFAVGLSRQLYGLTMHSERSRHRMYEQWHPLGVMGIVTAFNFPVAVWAWNAMIAAVCGDTMIWKPSSSTPLTAIAVTNIANRVLEKHGHLGIINLAIGSGGSLGEWLINDPRIPLISATGSCRMGKRIGEVVGKRLGRCILELGGNNAITVMPSADLDLAVRGILFGAVGTAGQRCTTTRRVFIHQQIEAEFTERLVKAYQQVTIGSPLDSKVLMGPLVNRMAVDQMMRVLDEIKKHGGEILSGGRKLNDGIYAKGHFVQPTIVRAMPALPLLKEETFAPILYLVPVDNLETAIRLQNDVPQGLSSAIFTNHLKEAETFLSHLGSDCGIANVNIGTSGAEIGGAFGGEKETGGGREAGSDAWKGYMRRQTCTLNWGDELPLAQGIEFG